MSNSFYTHGTAPQSNSDVRSYPMRNEFDLITLAFSKFPTLVVSNAARIFVVNNSGDGVTITTGTFASDGDFATTGAFNTTFVASQSTTYTLPDSAGTLRTNYSMGGHVWGCTISNNVSDAVNDIDIAPGQAGSSGVSQESETMVLTSSITKQLDASWVAGTNQGGRATGVALSNVAYFVFLVKTNTGAIDVAFDSIFNGSNVAATAGIAKYRRIGMFKRFGDTILPFRQQGDYFYLKEPTGTVTTITSTSDLGYTEDELYFNTSAMRIVYMLKVYLKDSTPATNRFFRFRHTGVNDVASETNAVAVTGVGNKRSKANLIYLPPISGSFMAGRRSSGFTGTNNAFVTVPIGWIDYRIPGL